MSMFKTIDTKLRRYCERILIDWLKRFSNQLADQILVELSEKWKFSVDRIGEGTTVIRIIEKEGER